MRYLPIIALVLLTSLVALAIWVGPATAASPRVLVAQTMDQPDTGAGTTPDQPGAAQPDAGQVTPGQPGAAQPDVEQPDMAQPDMQPGVQPDTQPGVQQPGTVEAVPGQPGAAQPGVQPPAVTQPAPAQCPGAGVGGGTLMGPPPGTPTGACPGAMTAQPGTVGAAQAGATGAGMRVTRVQAQTGMAAPGGYGRGNGQRQLPRTGMDALSVYALGMGLIGAGTLLRRRKDR